MYLLVVCACPVGTELLEIGFMMKKLIITAVNIVIGPLLGVTVGLLASTVENNMTPMIIFNMNSLDKS
jgi:ABC-type lipoprotein release transport system permease subunit